MVCTHVAAVLHVGNVVVCVTVQHAVAAELFVIILQRMRMWVRNAVR